MAMSIDRAIFLTNVFAQSHPDEHLQLWQQFEQEVPLKERTGAFGSDNLAYIGWLKKKQEPVFIGFVRNNIDTETW